MSKPIKAKPGLYALFYENLKHIALEYGYNLVVHGSMQRDLDLIAIPWVDNPNPEFEMIQDFQMYLTGYKPTEPDYSVLPGGRHAYVITLNRGNKEGEWVRFYDEQYYLDISIVQLPNNK